MSPEQVRGELVDPRSDIFSFGLVLFELLTARHPFRRDSAVETMNNIAKEPTPHLKIRGLQYPAIERLVRHCLEKKPDDRFQAARDLLYSLETLIPEAAPRRAWRRWLGVALAMAAVAAIGAAGVTTWRAAKNERTFVPAARYRQLTYRSGELTRARFTPDGHTYVFSAAWDDQPPEPFVAITEGVGARPLGLPRASVLSIAAGGEMATLLDGARLAIVPLGGGGAPREVATDVVDADFVPGTSTLAAIRRVDGEDRVELPLGRVIFRSRSRLDRMRVLPGGERVALTEHPTPSDDGGRVAVIDTRGGLRALTRTWSSLRGLALSGDEVWFVASDGGGMCELRAVTLEGRERPLATVPGELSIDDVRDGKTLLRVSRYRQTLMARVPGASHERSFTWLDYSLAVDLSADGRTLLFGETNQGGGPAYSIFLRRVDEPLAVRLGEGLPLALSPDEKWVLALAQAPVHPLVLVPTGAGSPATLAHDEIDHLAARWLPDGKRVMFLGIAPGGRPRLYLQAIEGDAPRPVGAEGMSEHFAISPDGAEVAVADEAGAVWRVPLDGGAPRPLTGLSPRQVPLRYTRDGALLVAVPDRIPLAIDRLPAGGRREPWKLISPAGPGWRSRIFVAIAADGGSYAYSYTRNLEELFLVDGLVR
jgi:hypothetical protein